MKKSLYISALSLSLMLSFSSCNNEIDDIFDQNAAERTESAMKDYEAFLLADGGKWRMEYFCNSTEEGYNFIVSFRNDGSVTISGKNKYINDGENAAFKTSTSLWDIIADYGPVLSFSSYNPVFHIFSAPYDIPGTTNPDTGTDIDETGKGHEGDYEFRFMEKVDENTLYLKGKKSGYSIMMYRVAPDFDDKAYFEEVDATEKKLFNARFNRLILTTTDGERFVMTGGASHIMTFYPEAGDAVTQVCTLNALVKADGFSFPTVLDIQRANGEEIQVQHFIYNEEDGTAICQENDAVLTAEDYTNIINTVGYVWQFPQANVNGQFATIYSSIVSDVKKKLKETFRYFEFAYDNNGNYTLRFKSGKYTGMIYCEFQRETATTGRFVFSGECDSSASYYYNNIPGFKELCDLIGSATVTFSSASRLVPNVLTFSLNAEDSITLKLQ